MGQHSNPGFEEKEAVALEIALEVGLLSQCELHEEIYDPVSNNYEDAYKLANDRISRKVDSVACFEGDRRALTDLIKGLPNRYPSRCPRCDFAQNEE